MKHQQPWILHLFVKILLIPLVSVPSLVDAAPLALWIAPGPPLLSNCESSFEGITYCVEDGGDMHMVVIDLNNPHVRFEMVMAADVSSVDTTQRERIEDIVTRSPYADETVVAAINADYFGRNHGPEGLTVQNGRRLDERAGLGENPHAYWRSSLAISRLNRISLGRKSPEDLAFPRALRERFYNAIGGGPMILSHGVVIPNSIACPLERFPVGACRRTIQTTAGLSQDGRWLYLAVGRGRDSAGFARLLRDYGASTGIKLDGGGSSQLWYDGTMRHDTDRPVGNALLVFYSPVPRHDARFSGPSLLPFVNPGEPVEIPYEIENTGFLDWEPDLGYRFKNVQGWPVLGPAYQRLPQPVAAGDLLASSFTVVAPHRPGVYTAEWQLVRRSEKIGNRIPFGMIVLPAIPDSQGLQDRIQDRITRLRARPGSDDEWAQLRGELQREIWYAIETELRALVTDTYGTVRLYEALSQEPWMPLPRHLPL